MQLGKIDAMSFTYGEGIWLISKVGNYSVVIQEQELVVKD